MKKLLVIVLFAIFGFGFTGIVSINAQNYSFDVEWDDTNCNCGTITYKNLEWDVKDYSSGSPQDFDYGNEDITSTSSPTTVYGNNDVVYDCRGCYYVDVTITYIDGNGVCCTGQQSGFFDGDELYNGTAKLVVTM